MDDIMAFARIADHPEAAAETARQKGKPVIGYFCSYTPEELIFASGGHPIRLFGAAAETTLADSHLQSYCCSLVRSALDGALTGRLSFLNGAVFPHTCDSIQRLSDIWRLNTNFDFFADVVLPVKLDTPSARSYLRDVLARFKNDLEAFTGESITDDDLKAALEKYNRLKGLLSTLDARRSEDPGIIEGRRFMQVTKGAMVMDRDEALERLPRVLEAADNRRYEWRAKSPKRVLLAGGVCDHPDIYDTVENAGGAVVGDDLCTGSRWFEAPIPLDGDPLDRLADRLADRPICPAKHASITRRAERLVALAKERRADGVIFIHLKFCDPHAFDYPYLREALEEAGVKSLLFEVEEQPPGVGQMETRFETFMHML